MFSAAIAVVPLPAVLSKTPTGGVGSNVGDATVKNGDMASVGDVSPEPTNLNNKLPVDPNDPNKAAKIAANDRRVRAQLANTQALRRLDTALKNQRIVIENGGTTAQRAIVAKEVKAAQDNLAKNPLYTDDTPFKKTGIL